MKRVHQAQRWAWIEDWLKAKFSAGCLNQEFHEEYHKRFPGYARRETYWGAQPVSQAMRDLAEMGKSGILDVGTISVGFNWQPGFPRYEKIYTLRKT